SHNKEACHICNKEINLGENLPKKQYITIAMNAEEQGNVQLSDISLYLDSEEGLTPRKNKFIKEGINFEVYAYKKGEGKRYLAYPLKATAAYTHTDKDGRITDFEVLSKKASVNWGDKGITGLQANAIIKGDVDDLGAIFQKGLAKDDKLSLARYVATSSMMDFFFSEYIPWLLENESAHFNNVSIPFDPIYTVYTGGDDFCLVGPWLNVLLFAKRLRDDFASFTCNNPEIHFSCGIELLHGKSPVKYSIEQTEKALGLAKKTHDLKYKETYKNSVYVFETLIPWDEYNDFIKEAETYLSWLQENNKEGFTTQLAYRLFKYQESYMKINYRKEGEKFSIRDNLYSAHINYDLNRNVKNNPLVYNSIKGLTQFRKENKIDFFRILKAILHVAIYADRK
ncbi:MAG TPA: hypothetical protein PKZ69_07070, partial [Candidatus Cloacimonadota bacterium]|nr:hypothetical protein [Candidatus Cloacimonadota bacterium]